MMNWYCRGVYQLTDNGVYSVSRSYNALKGSLERVKEADLIWSSLMMPRQRVVVWIAAQEKLLTKERLHRLNIQVENDNCCLCEEGIRETQQHPFVECRWITEVKNALSTWIGIRIQKKGVQQYMQWIKRRHWRQFKKEMLAAIWGSMIYHTWQARNWKIFRNTNVAEVSLLEESFEANVRDYTKIIHGYAKQNRLREAESMLLAMKTRGFTCDQVVLTALVHMYSKAGKLKMAEDTFEEMRLLGVTLDKRSYGSMIMAYVRAGMLGEGEALLKEMEEQEIYAGREVYKAILRAYSMIGDSKGAQRVFDALQLAGIIPDATVCGLLMNAYVVAGQLSEACIAFENLRRAGIEPNDKCIALLLSAYETENNLSKALDVLMNLERDGVVLGREASEILARWFKKLGVVGEVELVLREFMHQT